MKSKGIYNDEAQNARGQNQVKAFYIGTTLLNNNTELLNPDQKNHDAKRLCKLQPSVPKSTKLKSWVQVSTYTCKAKILTFTALIKYYAVNGNTFLRSVRSGRKQ